jgi:hypothetical protein
MGITDRVWDALTTVLRMNEKVERMSVTLKAQQDKIENLTERIIRLETALELGLAARPDRNAPGSLLPRG